MKILFSIKFTLIKRYHSHICNRVLLLFGKLPQWSLHVNCHVNRTTFQSGLRFQTGLSLLRVSCKRALKVKKIKVSVTIAIIVQYALNMSKFWLWQTFEYGRVLNMRALRSVLNMPEYVLAEFWIYLGF